MQWSNENVSPMKWYLLFNSEKNFVDSALCTVTTLFMLILKKAKNLLEPKTCLKMMIEKSLCHQVSDSDTLDLNLQIEHRMFFYRLLRSGSEWPKDKA